MCITVPRSLEESQARSTSYYTQHKRASSLQTLQSNWIAQVNLFNKWHFVPLIFASVRAPIMFYPKIAPEAQVGA